MHQSHSTIKNSEAALGGGIHSLGNLELNNVTVSNNLSREQGGGIYQASGSLTIQNSTIANNTVLGVSGFLNGSGGGIYNGTTGTISVRNSILSNNTALAGADCQGIINTSDHNLIGNTSGCTLSSSTGDLLSVDPLLPPSTYGNILPVAEGSPAINAGSSCLATDARNLTRPQGANCDIGAYEYPGTIGGAAIIEIVNGAVQHVPLSGVFTTPLSVFIMDADGDPVSGKTVTFTSPSTGPSAIFGDTMTNSIVMETNQYGVATVSNITANNQAGSYLITAEVAGLPSVNFVVANILWYVSPGGNNSTNSCTEPSSPCANLNGVFAKPDFLSGDTIYVAEGTYTGAQTMPSNFNAIISGGWDISFTSQNGYSTLNGSGLSITSEFIKISNFEIKNCVTGIENGNSSTYSILILDHISIHDCSSGAIRNYDSLTISNSTIFSNNANSSAGGINSDGVTGNTVLKVLNTAIHDNISATGAGGIKTSSNHQYISIINTTIYNNSGYDGGAYFASNATINNSTITENISTASDNTRGAGIAGNGITIQNSIISNNKKIPPAMTVVPLRSPLVGTIFLGH